MIKFSQLSSIATGIGLAGFSGSVFLLNRCTDCEKYLNLKNFDGSAVLNFINKMKSEPPTAEINYAIGSLNYALNGITSEAAGLQKVAHKYEHCPSISGDPPSCRAYVIAAAITGAVALAGLAVSTFGGKWIDNYLKRRKFEQIKQELRAREPVSNNKHVTHSSSTFQRHPIARVESEQYETHSASSSSRPRHKRAHKASHLAVEPNTDSPPSSKRSSPGFGPAGNSSSRSGLLAAASSSSPPISPLPSPSVSGSSHPSLARVIAKARPFAVGTRRGEIEKLLESTALNLTKRMPGGSHAIYTTPDGKHHVTLTGHGAGDGVSLGCVEKVNAFLSAAYGIIPTPKQKKKKTPHASSSSGTLSNRTIRRHTGSSSDRTSRSSSMSLSPHPSASSSPAATPHPSASSSATTTPHPSASSSAATTPSGSLSPRRSFGLRLDRLESKTPPASDSAPSSPGWDMEVSLPASSPRESLSGRLTSLSSPCEAGTASSSASKTTTLNSLASAHFVMPPAAPPVGLNKDAPAFVMPPAAPPAGLNKDAPAFVMPPAAPPAGLNKDAPAFVVPPAAPPAGLNKNAPAFVPRFLPPS